eukprot:symbB.v1.2.014045.t1/scaffold999.1/size145731/9
MPFELPAYRFCLERLELLGDAALKLMASVHCGACMPRASEGELSSSAQFFETNKWLRHVSKQTLDLPSYILLYAFRTKERLARLRRDGAPQKVLADAMEALLGAAFRCAASQGPASLSQGMAETWRIFGTLLKNSPVDSNVNTAVLEPFIPDFKAAVQAALSSRTATQQDPEMDQRCVEMVEQAMGYRFRNPKLLAALRAKPCGTRSTAFERLEFLGDAVLQVMANWHVMQEFPDFDEGELSDTQQALVSNHYISRKLVRRFDKDGLISVFFPGSNSPLQRHVMKFLTATTHEDTDFLVGDKTDIMAKGTRTSGAQNSEFKFIADAYEKIYHMTNSTFYPFTAPRFFKLRVGLVRDVRMLNFATALRAVPSQPAEATQEPGSHDIEASAAPAKEDLPDLPSSIHHRRRSLREKRRTGERRSMAAVARRLRAVMEERGSLSMVPEEKDSDCEDGLASNLFDRARSLSLSAVNSFAAAAAWAVTPQDTASTASSHSCTPLHDVSPSSSGSESGVQSPNSLGSFSSNSDSTVHFLGEALLRAREEAEQPLRADNVFDHFTMGIA